VLGRRAKRRRAGDRPLTGPEAALLGQEEAFIPPDGELVQVIAPHFCAGLIMVGERCIHSAPILRWCVGMRRTAIRASFERKGWKAIVL
jgi:hypothetical protein